MYCQIIYAQQDETFNEAEEILFDGGFPTIENIHAAVEFLSQWDYGYENEYDDALSEDMEVSRFDDVYEDEDSEYTLVVHRGLYIALWRPVVDELR